MAMNYVDEDSLVQASTNFSGWDPSAIFGNGMQEKNVDADNLSEESFDHKNQKSYSGTHIPLEESSESHMEENEMSAESVFNEEKTEKTGTEKIEDVPNKLPDLEDEELDASMEDSLSDLKSDDIVDTNPALDDFIENEQSLNETVEKTRFEEPAGIHSQLTEDEAAMMIQKTFRGRVGRKEAGRLQLQKERERLRSRELRKQRGFEKQKQSLTVHDGNGNEAPKSSKLSVAQEKMEIDDLEEQPLESSEGQHQEPFVNYQLFVEPEETIEHSMSEESDCEVMVFKADRTNNVKEDSVGVQKKSISPKLSSRKSSKEKQLFNSKSGHEKKNDISNVSLEVDMDLEDSLQAVTQQPKKLSFTSSNTKDSKIDTKSVFPADSSLVGKKPMLHQSQVSTQASRAWENITHLSKDIEDLDTLLQSVEVGHNRNGDDEEEEDDFDYAAVDEEETDIDLEDSLNLINNIINDRGGVNDQSLLRRSQYENNGADGRQKYPTMILEENDVDIAEENSSSQRLKTRMEGGDDNEEEGVDDDEFGEDSMVGGVGGIGGGVIVAAVKSTAVPSHYAAKLAKLNSNNNNNDAPKNVATGGLSQLKQNSYLNIAQQKSSKKEPNKYVVPSIHDLMELSPEKSSNNSPRSVRDEKSKFIVQEQQRKQQEEKQNYLHQQQIRMQQQQLEQDYRNKQISQAARRELKAASALTIQRVFRGFRARLIARKRKEMMIERYRCGNCGRVEIGGIYCKGCGRRQPRRNTSSKSDSKSPLRHRAPQPPTKLQGQHHGSNVDNAISPRLNGGGGVTPSSIVRHPSRGRNGAGAPPSLPVDRALSNPRPAQIAKKQDPIPIKQSPLKVLDDDNNILAHQKKPVVKSHDNPNRMSKRAMEELQLLKELEELDNRQQNRIQEIKVDISKNPDTPLDKHSSKPKRQAEEKNSQAEKDKRAFKPGLKADKPKKDVIQQQQQQQQQKPPPAQQQRQQQHQKQQYREYNDFDIEDDQTAPSYFQISPRPKNANENIDNQTNNKPSSRGRYEQLPDEASSVVEQENNGYLNVFHKKARSVSKEGHRRKSKGVYGEDDEASVSVVSAGVWSEGGGYPLRMTPRDNNKNGSISVRNKGKESEGHLPLLPAHIRQANNPSAEPSSIAMESNINRSKTKSAPSRIRGKLEEELHLPAPVRVSHDYEQFSKDSKKKQILRNKNA